MSFSRFLSGLGTAVALVGLWLVPVQAEAAVRPTATTALPQAISTSGGTKITIRGKNLQKVSAVYFGTTKTTKIKRVSKTAIVVTAPKHAQGVVKLKLRVGTKTYSTQIKVSYAVPTQQPSVQEAEVLRLTNLARAKGATCAGSVMPAVPPLKWNGLLGLAARNHSKDLAVRNYFSHTSRDGTSFSTRITRTGYSWSAVGENIAAGHRSPAEVVRAWLASPGHCSTLMRSTYTELGVGYATGGSYGTYWTQDFGRSRR